jgi:hypothetical protein
MSITFFYNHFQSLQLTNIQCQPFKCSTVLLPILNIFAVVEKHIHHILLLAHIEKSSMTISIFKEPFCQKQILPKEEDRPINLKKTKILLLPIKNTTKV